MAKKGDWSYVPDDKWFDVPWFSLRETYHQAREHRFPYPKYGFVGRFRDALHAINPSHLRYTQKDAYWANELLNEYQSGKVHDLHTKPDIPMTSMMAVTCEEVFGSGKCGPPIEYVDPRILWRARTIVDSRPQSQSSGTPGAMPLACLQSACRPSAVVPVHVPLVVGMLTCTTFTGHLVWHGLNQSYNWATHVNQTGKLYDAGPAAMFFGASVASSAGVAFGLRHLADKLPPTLARTAAIIKCVGSPLALAAANSVNVLGWYLDGQAAAGGVHSTIVHDEKKKILGHSAIAAKIVAQHDLLSRIVMPFPVLMLPPIIVASAQKCFPNQMSKKWILNTTRVAAVASVLALAIPLTLAVFPKTKRIPGSQLEPEFHKYDLVSIWHK